MTHFLHAVGAARMHATVDIVFIHGLGGDAHSTWQANGQSPCWRNWLYEDIGLANVWSCAYPARKFWESIAAGAGPGILSHAKSLIECLRLNGIGVRPIIFVCHSLGGLMAKAIIMACTHSDDPSWTAIANATKGVVFIATPHDGAALANILSMTPLTSTLVSQLKEGGDITGILDRFYRTKCRETALASKVFAETQNYKGVRVVPLASADPKIPGCECIPLDANHETICKPQNRDALLYKSVHQFIDELMLAFAERAIDDDYTRFTNMVDPKERLTLEDKLKLAGRPEKIQQARKSEERFFMRMNKNILQGSAKRKYVDILAEVKARFSAYVEPGAKAGEMSATQIDQATFEKVVEPIAEKYKEDPVAPLNHEGVDDAVMFLAGKCHIRWDNGDV